MNVERTPSLARAIVEIESHVAQGGWDAPVGVFALVHTNAALGLNPAMADDLGTDIVQSAQADPHHILSIEQDGLPEAGNVEELLAQLSWPETVHGAALVVERVALPPSVEAQLPEDPAAQVEFMLNHPERQDVRLAVAVLRTGENWCAVRTRANDSDDAVAQGADVAPHLIEALLATFTDTPGDSSSR